jgi:sulfur-oxidizing protein SoxX
MESSPDSPSSLGEGRGGGLWALAVLFLAGACASVDRTSPAATGDPVRGREVFVSREAGHCVLCHRAPGVETAGDVGPALHGIGARLSAEELRLRVADITRVYPDSVMPTFHRTEGLKRVSKAHEGKPVLDRQQLEDVVAWLGTLR